MSNIVKKEDLPLLVRDQLAEKILEQEIKEVFLFKSHVAGTSHIANIEEVFEKLKSGDKLAFQREKNHYDEMAIMIIYEGLKLGYVPKEDNIIFSRLLDAGQILYSRVTKKDKRGSWHQIYIDIMILLV